MQDDGHIGELWVDLFIFAEAYGIPALRMHSLSRLVRCFDPRQYWNAPTSWSDQMRYFSKETIKYAYEKTNTDSPLRRVLVAGFSQFSDEDNVLTEDMPAQFLLDVVKYLQKRTRASRKGGDPVFRIPNACEFHEHESAKEKRRCQNRWYGYLDGL